MKFNCVPLDTFINLRLLTTEYKLRMIAEADACKHGELGETKYWLDPEIELARNYHLSRQQLKQIEQLIEEHYDELTSAWKKHFPR